MTDSNRLRNFCIIAHVDHGKSTLADRFLELTGTIPQGKIHDQYLDQMDLEQERGITIKLAPVRMDYQGYVLNLIDTPGHADFNYEVSRSLAAVEGAILLVDATSGIQAQTLANWRLARDLGLYILPVVNKIDLPQANFESVADSLASLLGVETQDILAVSAKQGKGVAKLLDEIIKKIPSPKGETEAPLQASIFDSIYDSYRGIVTYIRVKNGAIRSGEEIKFLGTATTTKVLEVGTFKPQRQKQEHLVAGEIGYVMSGAKHLGQTRVGDTIISTKKAAPALPGYHQIKPVVFAGVFAENAEEGPKLRVALERLRLNDAAITCEPEKGSSLGDGFRCGFLGLLHLDITRERLRREFGIGTILTTPTTAFRISERQGSQYEITGPKDFPDPSLITKIEEPWVKLTLVVPENDLGSVFQLIIAIHGQPGNHTYLDERSSSGRGRTVMIEADVPLQGLIVDFADRLKSATSGFGSFEYEIFSWQETDIVRLDILVAGERLEGLARLVWREEVERIGRTMVTILKDAIPRQLFEVRLQAAVGGTIVAAERVPPLRKDVTAKLYGGDVTRKMKVLERQRRGKREMAARTRVTIPSEVYVSVLTGRRSDQL